MSNLCGDCKDIALSKMFKSVGIDISPAMCFGLGEGLDFRYWVETQTKIPIVVILGRNFDSEWILAKNIGVTLNELTPNLKNNSDINVVLENGKEVFINLDRYYLEYIKQILNMYHCGNHCVVIEKFCESNHSYTVYDGLIDNDVSISDTELRLARSSKYEPFAPNYYGFFIDKIDNYKKIDCNSIAEAISSNCKRMLSEERRGLASMNKFIKEITSLSKELLRSNDMKVNLKMQMKFISKYILEFENNNSFYRQVYCKFLKESEQFFTVGYFEKSICNFKELGKMWNALGQELKNKSLGDVEEYFDNIGNELNALYEKESSSIIGLLDYITRY